MEKQKIAFIHKNSDYLFYLIMTTSDQIFDFPSLNRLHIFASANNITII